jgi:hypothetical protein
MKKNELINRILNLGGYSHDSGNTMVFSGDRKKITYHGFNEIKSDQIGNELYTNFLIIYVGKDKRNRRNLSLFLHELYKSRPNDIFCVGNYKGQYYIFELI